MNTEGKNINAIDSKLKTTFAVFVMFVLMAAVAVVFLGIEIPSQQQQSTQKKQLGSDVESSSLPASKLTGLVEELENQDYSFLDKSTTTTNEPQEKQEYGPNYISGLNCEQLSDIASSFENGWGRALAEYSSRCEIDNVNDSK